MKKEKKIFKKKTISRLQKFNKLKEKREHSKLLIANNNNDNAIDNDNDNNDNDSNAVDRVYKRAGQLESNYLYRIKDIDSKDLKKYFESVNKELENYFKEKKLVEIRELESLEKGLYDGYYKRKYQKQIKELRESL